MLLSGLVGCSNEIPKKKRSSLQEFATMHGREASSPFGDDVAVIHKVSNIMSDEKKSKVLSSQRTFTNFRGHRLPGSSMTTT